MLDFVPVEFYHDIFVYFILILCLITSFHTLVLTPNESKTVAYNNTIGIFILFIVIAYVGLRPLNGIFIDMTTYARMFTRFQHGNYQIESDYGFFLFLLLCAKITTLEMFFFLSACIYTIPLYKACKNWFPNHYFFAFLLFVGSFSFLNYGTNGIRNGMAASLFVLALSYNKKNNVLMVLFFLLSYSFHNSMVLPILAFIITYYIVDTKKYYLFYISAIVLSIALGSFFENIFSSLGLGDDRFSAYLTTDSDPSKFASTGFRYDFLLYSAAPIILSAFYKFKNGYKSIIYDRILHAYITTNAFWILIIRANFSNRFAYLSWLFMAVVVIYPLLDKIIWKNQFKKLGNVILLYFAFTLIMHIYYTYTR